MNIILIIYLITVGLCILSFVCCILDTLVFCKTNNLKPKKKESFVSSVIKLLVVSAIPLLNIVYFFIVMFSSKFKEDLHDRLLAEKEAN